MIWIKWIAVVAGIAWAIRKKNLTTWIMVSLVAGVCIGIDFPALGLELKF
jgi:proton glutamate symport protein